MKLQGLEDANEQQTVYNFVAEEYPGDRMRIHAEAVAVAVHAQTTRANVMNALTELPVLLLTEDYYAGVEFYEHYRQGGLYIGRFDDKNDPVSPVLGLPNDTNNTAITASFRKRSLDGRLFQVQQTNTSTTVMTSLGTNELFEIKFKFVGSRIPKLGTFTALLHTTFGVGLDNSVDQVEQVETSQENMPVWVFMRLNPESTYPLANFHILGILEAIARHYSTKTYYREILYDLFVDGAFVSGGCLTKQGDARRWCQGLRGERRAGIATGIAIGPFSPEA